MKRSFALNCSTAGILIAALAQTSARSESLSTTSPAPVAAPSTSLPSSRYGLFNALDHRSFYNEGNFPEPFLVDDTGLELDEARLDWRHDNGGPQAHADEVLMEVEHGFGLLTLELAVPYVREVESGAVTQGIGNIELGARHPVYQFVSEKGFFDTTCGVGIEVAVPASPDLSVNTEIVPKVFNDTRIGNHFTVQTLLGYSTLVGGGGEGGTRNFEYGFVFGYSIDRPVTPIPSIQQFIPMFELTGETGLNQSNRGQTSLLGDACFRVYLKPFRGIQPRLGAGYVFPLNDVAREETKWGVITSLVFEY
ncbi:MAG: hypothetical protein U1F98_12475 [Verrucomicrobiota bacterium]